MTPEEFPPEGRVYRHSRWVLEFGVAFASLFALAGMGGCITALLNVDGSFAHPVAAAVFNSVFCACPALVGCRYILSYFRHRLLVSREFVHATGCLGTREVQLVCITSANWKMYSNTLVLRDHSLELTISFCDYTLQERLELIHFFRWAIAEHVQKGWERFELYRVPAHVDCKKLQQEIRGHMRFAVIAWGAAVPVMYGLLIWQNVADLVPRSWVMVAVLPIVIAGAILGGMWLAARGDLAKAQERKDAEQ
jgi:hypothetical protein